MAGYNGMGSVYKAYLLHMISTSAQKATTILSMCSIDEVHAPRPLKGGQLEVYFPRSK